MKTLDEPRIAGDLWDNKSAPGGAGNTIRGLTHSLDLTKEGLDEAYANHDRHR